MQRAYRSVVPVAVLALTLTVGCSAPGEDDEVTEDPAAATTEPDDAEEATEPDADEVAEPDDADEPEVTEDTAPDAGSDGEPLGTAEASWGGGGGGQVRVDLLSVTRRGEDFLEVAFRLTAVDSSIYPYERLASDEDADELEQWASGVTVEDVDAGERLLVLRDSAGGCVCSTDLGQSIREGGSRDYFARFPAPVSDRVDVAIPTFAPFNDVPVS